MGETDQTPELPLAAKLEALLFVASEAVTLSQLASVLEVSSKEVEKGLEILETSLDTGGLRLQRHKGGVQLTTAPEISMLIERFLGLDTTTRLSRPALETLALIAYQQPVTRPQVDAIRGVNSDGVMRSLVSRGLIQELGRAEGPGRPILYGTAADFLGYFGLKSLTELPPLDTDSTREDDEQDVSLLKG